jgi:hypothetical protein
VQIAFPLRSRGADGSAGVRGFAEAKPRQKNPNPGLRQSPGSEKQCSLQRGEKLKSAALCNKNILSFQLLKNTYFPKSIFLIAFFNLSIFYFKMF